MTISVESFLVLEKSLSKVISSEVSAALKDDLAEILILIQNNDYDEATEKIASIVVSVHDYKYFKTIGTAAMLFGVGQLTEDTPELDTEDEQVQSKLNAAVVMAGIMAGQLLTGAVRKALLRTVLQQKSNYAIGVQEAFIMDTKAAVKFGVKDALEIANSLHVSRMASYGFLSEAITTGVDMYRITAVLDTRTCPVCRAIDGRVFSVPHGKAKMDVALGVEHPDDLKALSPWPSQSKDSVAVLEAASDAEVEAAGFSLPPFHPKCRCIVTKL